MRTDPLPYVAEAVHVVAWLSARGSLGCSAGLVLDVAYDPATFRFDRVRVRILGETAAVETPGARDREAWTGYDPTGERGLGWHHAGACETGIAETAARRLAVARPGS